MLFLTYRPNRAQRKGQEMNIEIRLNDGTTLLASYEASQEEMLKVFYDNQKTHRQISGYIMRNNRGKIVKLAI